MLTPSILILIVSASLFIIASIVLYFTSSGYSKNYRIGNSIAKGSYALIIGAFIGAAVGMFSMEVKSIIACFIGFFIGGIISGMGNNYANKVTPRKDYSQTQFNKNIKTESKAGFDDFHDDGDFKAVGSYYEDATLKENEDKSEENDE